jgi:hypothetical protein
MTIKSKKFREIDFTKKTKKLLQAKKKEKQSLCSLPTISNSRGSQKSGSGILYI